MATEIPDWLNESFFEKIFRKSENDDSIRVINVISKPATSKGDNYTSEIIRADVELSTKENKTERKSIIVKLAPLKEGVQKEIVQNIGLFDKETAMMTDTLPKMNALLDPSKRLSAKALYFQKDDPVLLVLEDLAPLGFKMTCRQVGLDLQHCLLAVHALARFHATSVAICEKDPSCKRKYPTGIFDKSHPPEIKNYFTSSLKLLAEEVATWPEAAKYAEKIRNLSDRIYDIGIEASQADESEFNVINHGDCWVNNMLFRYDNNGKPVGHIFVDFQLCAYTSPAIDLHYFLGTSPSDDVYFNHKDTLLVEYQKVLSSIMTQLGCKTAPPSLNSIKEIVKKRAIYGLIASFTVLPIVLVDKSDVQSVDEMIKEDGLVSNPGIKGAQYRKTMLKRLPLYEQMGLLDNY